MPKNISDQTFKNIIPNALKEMKNLGKQNRTNQVSPLGYFPLPPGTSTTVEADATIPDGSLYYATDLGKSRKKEAGVWSNM